MLQQDLTAESKSSDPMKSAADAVAMAFQAAREGASDAESKVNEMMPAIGGFISRLTYTTCYAVSYGIVFPTVLMARSVPKDNVLVQGLIDGAHSAQGRVAAFWDGSGPAEGHAPDTHPGIIIPGSTAASPGSETHQGIIIPGSSPTFPVSEARHELIIPDHDRGT